MDTTKPQLKNFETGQQAFDAVSRIRAYIPNLKKGDIVRKDGINYSVVTPWNGKQATMCSQKTHFLYSWGTFDFPEYLHDGRMKK